MIGSTLPSKFNSSDLRRDLIAGLTVAVMIIPQGMAYALLAGLPPIYGLYAAFIPLLVYPFFGSSRELSVGPVALVSIIVLAGVSQWAEPGSARFIELALLTSLVAGVIQILLSVSRMGFLVNFLSEPVIVGFTTAAALIIALSQFKYILDIQIGDANNVVDILINTFQGAGDTNLYSLLLGGGAIIFILAVRQIKKSAPGALLAVIIGALLVQFLVLQDRGVSIVGDVPGGLPPFDLSFINYRNIILVTPLAIVICIISFIESLAIAQTLAKKQGNHVINPDKELLGLGMSKIIGSFFQAYPNTGSFTRSAINADAGARSGLSSMFAGLLIGIILLFFTTLFYYLPKAILGGIVVTAVIGLINIQYGKELYRFSRKEFAIFSVTGLLTLLMGIQEGVFVGIVLSLLLIIRQASKPHFAILGNLPGTTSYRNINRYPEARLSPGVVIIRYDESIYFANANHFQNTLNNTLDKYPGTHTIILNCTAMSSVDSTGIHKIVDILEDFNKRGVKVLFTDMRGPMRDLFEKSGINKRIGYENNYLSIHDAMDGHDLSNGATELSRKYASQKNK